MALGKGGVVAVTLVVCMYVGVYAEQQMVEPVGHTPVAEHGLPNYIQKRSELRYWARKVQNMYGWRNYYASQLQGIQMKQDAAAREAMQGTEHEKSTLPAMMDLEEDSPDYTPSAKLVTSNQETGPAKGGRKAARVAGVSRNRVPPVPTNSANQMYAKKGLLKKMGSIAGGAISGGLSGGLGGALMGGLGGAMGNPMMGAMGGMMGGAMGGMMGGMNPMMGGGGCMGGCCGGPCGGMMGMQRGRCGGGGCQNYNRCGSSCHERHGMMKLEEQMMMNMAHPGMGGPGGQGVDWQISQLKESFRALEMQVSQLKIQMQQTKDMTDMKEQQQAQLMQEAAAKIAAPAAAPAAAAAAPAAMPAAAPAPAAAAPAAAAGNASGSYVAPAHPATVIYLPQGSHFTNPYDVQQYGNMMGHPAEMDPYGMSSMGMNPMMMGGGGMNPMMMGGGMMNPMGGMMGGMGGMGGMMGGMGMGFNEKKHAQEQADMSEAKSGDDDDDDDDDDSSDSDSGDSDSSDDSDSGDDDSM